MLKKSGARISASKIPTEPDSHGGRSDPTRHQGRSGSIAESCQRLAALPLISAAAQAGQPEFTRDDSVFQQPVKPQFVGGLRVEDGKRIAGELERKLGTPI